MRLRHSVLRMVSASYLRLSIWNRHAADPLIYLGLCRCKFALRVPQHRKGAAELEKGISSSCRITIRYSHLELLIRQSNEADDLHPSEIWVSAA